MSQEKDLRNYSRRIGLLAIRLGAALLLLAGPAVAAESQPPARPVGATQALPLTDLLRRPVTDPASVAALAEEGTAFQAAGLGVMLRAVRQPVHSSPSEALADLLVYYHMVTDGPRQAALRSLDSLPEPVRASLTRVVDAFLGFAEATRMAYADADAATLLSGPPSLRDAGLDLGPVLSARTELLRAVLALQAATAEFPPPYRATAGTVDMCPVVALDLSGTLDSYTTDCRLIVDIGGADQYANNAGGNGGACILSNVLGNAAAVADLSGDDAYGVGSQRRSCGANGGGAYGAGFLYDAEGRDSYQADLWGTNGGGVIGSGFLLDADGDDYYSATAFGANGGGYTGAGLLIDVAGSDRYLSETVGVNGGGNSAGVGFLLDVDGTDYYSVFSWPLGGNGGGSLGLGLLHDGGGVGDTYVGDEGAGTDRSVRPTGILGAQIDSTNP